MGFPPSSVLYLLTFNHFQCDQILYTFLFFFAPEIYFLFSFTRIKKKIQWFSTLLNLFKLMYNLVQNVKLLSGKSSHSGWLPLRHRREYCTLNQLTKLLKPVVSVVIANVTELFVWKAKSNLVGQPWRFRCVNVVWMSQYKNNWSYKTIVNDVSIFRFTVSVRLFCESAWSNEFHILIFRW